MNPGNPWGELVLPVFAALLAGDTVEEEDRAALFRRLAGLLPGINLEGYPGPARDLAWAARRDIETSLAGSDLRLAAEKVLEGLENKLTPGSRPPSQGGRA